MPNWLWMLILVAIVLPFHVLFILPWITASGSLGVMLGGAAGYFGLGLIWSYVGFKTGIVDRP